MVDLVRGYRGVNDWQRALVELSVILLIMVILISREAVKQENYHYIYSDKDKLGAVFFIHCVFG